MEAIAEDERGRHALCIQLQAMARGVSTRTWFADKVAVMRQQKEMEKMEAAIEAARTNGAAETVQRVARRMGMSLKQLMLLNYDLKAQLEGNDEVPLALHQQLCLIPNSCTGLASTTFSQIKLEDEDTLAKYAADALSVPAA